MLKGVQPIPVAQGVIMSEWKLPRPTTASNHLCMMSVETGAVWGGEVSVLKDFRARLCVSR